MFYTNTSERIINKALGLLELIQDANKRAEYQRAELARWDNAKWNEPIKYFGVRSNFVKEKVRYENLAKWLTKRYLNVLVELAEETGRRLPENQIVILQKANVTHE